MIQPRKIAILFTFIALLPSLSFAATILVFGDSLSAGYGVPTGQGWVDLLKVKLEKTPFSLVNASISGETTTGGLSRIEPALKKFSPAIVILELGANDGLRGEPLEIAKRNLDAIALACKKHHARVLLVGMRLPPNYGLKYSDEFSRIYPDLAKRHDLALVPFMLEGFAGNMEDFQPDGLHPSAKAQGKVLSNIWKILEPMLGMH